MIKLHRLKSNQAGFTGIEVLIVLVIVAIVALLVVNNLQSATAESRDIERRTDINGLQTALESHWHTNESYPTDLNSLQVNFELLTDPNGNNIKIGEATDSENKPAAGYTLARPDQEYAYFPYLCGTVEEEVADEEAEEATDEEEADEEATEAEADTPETCQKYVLYSWLERATIDELPYEKNNLHNQD